jgi:hypothetical protein
LRAFSTGASSRPRLSRRAARRACPDEAAIAASLSGGVGAALPDGERRELASSLLAAGQADAALDLIEGHGLASESCARGGACGAHV